MAEQAQVLEYKCPCCNAGLTFGSQTQKMTCAYCDNEFELDAVKDYNNTLQETNSESIQWEDRPQQEWNAEEQAAMRSFICPSCGGEILTDGQTAATFCPYCDNPTILPGRVSGGLKPDALIPFKTTKEDAKAAFLKLCKGKPLLPRLFTQQHRLERITGMYVPFWLYDCDTGLDGSYKATRVRHWSDSNYNYTKTDHYLLKRQANAVFTGIPMDGSSKMDDVFMESIEPYHYEDLTDFDSGYLSGYLADKYDVSSDTGKERIRQRISQSMDDLLQSSFMGYASVIPTTKQLSVKHGKARYVLLPVWMLNTRYAGKLYTFAMNGQTGKMTGTFPICPKRTAAWFCGLTAALTLFSFLVSLFVV